MRLQWNENAFENYFHIAQNSWWVTNLMTSPIQCHFGSEINRPFGTHTHAGREKEIERLCFRQVSLMVMLALKFQNALHSNITINAGHWVYVDTVCRTAAASAIDWERTRENDSQCSTCALNDICIFIDLFMFAFVSSFSSSSSAVPFLYFTSFEASARARSPACGNTLQNSNSICVLSMQQSASAMDMEWLSFNMQRKTASWHRCFVW